MSDLDLRGLKCPLPALKTERRLEALGPGERLAVLADDPLAPLDLAHLCLRRGDRLVLSERLDGGAHRFLIERGAAG